MDHTHADLESLPDGGPVDYPSRPRLTQGHGTRVRKLWSYGRPVNVGELSGLDLDLFHGFVEPVDTKHSACAVASAPVRCSPCGLALRCGLLGPPLTAPVLRRFDP